ncbi:MAG: hypothetical protein M0Z31_12345 [Clostridia bacterium]|nr:hypothetical protein [Clostridia bacterium]
MVTIMFLLGIITIAAAIAFVISNNNIQVSDKEKVIDGQVNEKE